MTSAASNSRDGDQVERVERITHDDARGHRTCSASSGAAPMRALRMSWSKRRRSGLEFAPCRWLRIRCRRLHELDTGIISTSTATWSRIWHRKRSCFPMLAASPDKGLPKAAVLNAGDLASETMRAACRHRPGDHVRPAATPTSRRATWRRTPRECGFVCGCATARSVAIPAFLATTTSRTASPPSPSPYRRAQHSPMPC